MRRNLLTVALASVLGFLVPNAAMGQPYGYTDAWSEEEEVLQGEPTPAGLIYGFGLTGGDYGDIVAVATEVFSPSGAPMAFDYAQGDWEVSVNLTAYVAANGEDGEYQIRSDHYADVGGQLGWLPWFAMSNLFVGIHTYYTRYWYNVSADMYYNWFCGNACQKTGAYIPMPGRPPFIQGAGKRIRILFWNYCRIGLYPRYESTGLICWPPT
jgi:hypothetical protein